MTAKDKLVDKVTRFIDRNGFVISKDSTPFSSQLEMEHSIDGFEFYMTISVHAQGNGSCLVTVKKGKKTVFKAAGSYTSGPYNCDVTTDSSREWEKLIK